MLSTFPVWWHVFFLQKIWVHLGPKLWETSKFDGLSSLPLLNWPFLGMTHVETIPIDVDSAWDFERSWRMDFRIFRMFTCWINTTYDGNHSVVICIRRTPSATPKSGPTLDKTHRTSPKDAGWWDIGDVWDIWGPLPIAEDRGTDPNLAKPGIRWNSMAAIVSINLMEKKKSTLWWTNIAMENHHS
jgi:hypothetical protein